MALYIELYLIKTDSHNYRSYLPKISTIDKIFFKTAIPFSAKSVLLRECPVY